MNDQNDCSFWSSDTQQQRDVHARDGAMHSHKNYKAKNMQEHKEKGSNIGLFSGPFGSNAMQAEALVGRLWFKWFQRETNMFMCVCTSNVTFKSKVKWSKEKVVFYPNAMHYCK